MSRLYKLQVMKQNLKKCFITHLHKREEYNRKSCQVPSMDYKILCWPRPFVSSVFFCVYIPCSLWVLWHCLLSLCFSDIAFHPISICVIEEQKEDTEQPITTFFSIFRKIILNLYFQFFWHWSPQKTKKDKKRQKGKKDKKDKKNKKKDKKDKKTEKTKKT